MKRVSSEKRWRWKLLSEERFRHRMASQRRREQAIRANAPTPTRASDKRTERWPVAYAPPLFVLSDDAHRAKVLSFIATIRKHVRGREGRVILDFSKTEKMFPCGTLLLVAELDRLRINNGSNSCFRCRYPKDRVVEQVLQQVGVLDILRCKSRHSASSFPENVRHWRFATADNVDGQKFEAVSHGLEGEVAPILLQEFFASITEAMTNSIQHAYAEDRGDDIPNRQELRRWWMFSQERDGHLSFVFCDTGIGIPRSMKDPKHIASSRIRVVLQTLGFSDGAREAELIKVAVELRKSSTGAQHRGRGLTEIRDVIQRSGVGHLIIHGNRGFYRYDGTSQTELLYDYPQSIMGTLIWWRVPIDAMRSAQ